MKLLQCSLGRVSRQFLCWSCLGEDHPDSSSLQSCQYLCDHLQNLLNPDLKFEIGQGILSGGQSCVLSSYCENHSHWVAHSWTCVSAAAIAWPLNSWIILSAQSLLQPVDLRPWKTVLPECFFLHGYFNVGHCNWEQEVFMYQWSLVWVLPVGVSMRNLWKAWPERRAGVGSKRYETDILASHCWGMERDTCSELRCCLLPEYSTVMAWQGKGRVVLVGKQTEKAAAMSSSGFYSLANQKDVWWPKMTFLLLRAVPWEEDHPLLLPYSPSDLNLHFRFSLGFWIPNWWSPDWVQVLLTIHVREEECFVSLCVLIVLLVCPLSPSELWVDQSGGWLVSELSHKLAVPRIWKEGFIVKAVNLTVWLDFVSSDCLLMICSLFVVFCLELLGSDLSCCREVSGSQTSQNSCSMLVDTFAVGFCASYFCVAF